MLVDYFKKPVKQGDSVLYPIYARGSMQIRQMTVVEHTREGLIGTSTTGRKIKLKNLNNLIRVDSLCPDTTSSAETADTN